MALPSPPRTPPAISGLVLFDNGDDRGVAVVAGGTCGVTGQPACYSTVPVFTIDETAMTATLRHSTRTETTPSSEATPKFSRMATSNMTNAYTVITPATMRAIYEVTQSSTPQTVWQMTISGQYVYRGMRMPSLYPGVQW